MLNILWNVFAIRKPILKLKKCWGNVLQIKNIQKEDEMFKLDVNYRIFWIQLSTKIKLQFEGYKLNHG